MNSIQDIYSVLQFSLSPGMFVRNLIVALVCGFAISRFYLWSSRSSANARNFVNSLIAMTMITAVVILVIGNNLARAFGLVGAMSIIRFRTAVKDVQDIVFIFFSLSIGMAAGIGMSMIAFIGTLGIGLVILVFSRVQMHADGNRNYLLQFSFYPENGKEEPYYPVLQRFCDMSHLMNIKYIESDGHLEISFYIRLRNEASKDGFVLALSKIPGMRNINVFFDEE